MGVERARVVEVYARAGGAARVGSGYLVADRSVLTAVHAVRGVPTHGTGSADTECVVRPLEQTGWTAVQVVWRDEDQDLAVVAAPPEFAGLPAGSPPPR